MTSPFNCGLLCGDPRVGELRIRNFAGVACNAKTQHKISSIGNESANTGSLEYSERVGLKGLRRNAIRQPGVGL